MARGVTLGQLVDKLRVATRHDPNPALSKNLMPLFKQTLSDTQERLYDEFDWPFLKVQRDKALAAGQRYYDLPDDMNLERVIEVDVWDGNRWLPVHRGIPLDCYGILNSDNDARQDPVQRWDVVDTGDGEQIEVWPLPATNNLTLRFSGIRTLNPLVANDDRCDLDDQLIVLYSAGEILGGSKNPAAQLKIGQANRRKETLQGRVTKRRDGGFTMGGDLDPSQSPMPRTIAITAVQQD